MEENEANTSARARDTIDVAVETEPELLGADAGVISLTPGTEVGVLGERAPAGEIAAP